MRMHMATGIAALLRSLGLAVLIFLFLGIGAERADAQACPPGQTRQEVGSDGLSFCITDNAAPSDDTRGENALALFYFSMGRTGDGAVSAQTTCLSCDFITYFTSAMANFSATIFTYFQEFFVVLAPLLLAAWIAVRVIRLSIAGGEGGGAFFNDMVKKMALFFFAWGFLFNGFGLMGPVGPGQGTGSTYYAGPAWHLTAPDLLEYSFNLNSDIRSQTASGLMSLSAGDVDSGPFECAGLDQRVRTLVNNAALNPSIQSITQTACVVERMHTLGISTGVALLTSAWHQGSYTAWGLLSSNFKTIWGVVLLGIYGISAVWLVFLLLDVVTKALIVSAFLPLFGLAALFPATREVAQSALKHFISVPVVAFALGLTSLLGFFLIIGTVTVYNQTYEQISIAYNSTLSPIAQNGIVEQFAEFIRRIQLPVEENDAIPADLTSPWLHYLMMVGLGIFSLGRKIVSIIENIMEVQGSSEMADNAKKMALKAGAMSVATVGLAAKTAMSAVPVVGSAGAMALGAGGYLAGRAGNKMMGVGSGLQSMGAKTAKYGAKNLMQRVTPFGRNKG